MLYRSLFATIYHEHLLLYFNSMDQDKEKEIKERDQKQGEQG